ncbi:sporulation delaying protein family toxin [Bacillus subtilis]|uniref:sporulation delaying protein family toxin n=1 Tax=Bacillus subtilis TaxID=1423 RepID=UPI0002B409F2|nr:sporulation delaying protein family toxin [Bacillus subtilis]AGE62956.1 hypothetical protein C663_1129 [Bacillus subtilis XF-1]AGI28376.1 hypothetical protein I653_05590 [Bacillus subtilis subsp. subtilis str. BAB-1]AKD34492.1 hypothetical protein AW03_010990 [Bacillus subtilis HJ5]ALS82740.1 hypothetical protein AT706_12640 [Bacillus subtilis subsp. subtilis]ASK23129.1 hypothetical protein BSSX_1233 [Bacillus subtilis]
MKKAFLVFLSVVLVTTVFLVKQQESVAQAKQLEYSGEEIFKGFVFAQGEVGKQLPEVFNKAMTDKLNTKQAKAFANQVVADIKKEDADFFDNLKKAVYSKDALKVDELLKKAGQIVEEKVEATKEIAASKDDTSRVQAELVNTVDTANYFYYVSYVAAAGALILIILAIDITPIAISDNVDREMAIRTLVDELN